jgi:hypothetical protein
MMQNYLIWLTFTGVIIECLSKTTNTIKSRKVEVYEAATPSAEYCEEVWVTRSSNTSIDEIATRFHTNSTYLLRINPNLSETKLDAGTPICVVGNITESSYQGMVTVKIGERNENLSTYTVSPSMYINCTSIIQYAKPYLSPLEFLELNPTLRCSELATKETIIYLPSGTTIQPSASTVMTSTVEGDQDCIVGPWGEWTDCNGRNIKARYRNVYQQATGDGAACPSVHESQICNTPSSDNSQSVTASSITCPSGINGCSVPWRWTYYYLFTPACNVHDLCYVCNQEVGWEFALKSYCDEMFKSKMTSLCETYWVGKPFDLSWCLITADAYYTAVDNFGGKYFYGAEGNNEYYAADSCLYMPWSSELNNVGPNMGFYPEWAGCVCPERSCDFIY